MLKFLFSMVDYKQIWYILIQILMVIFSGLYNFRRTPPYFFSWKKLFINFLFFQISTQWYNFCIPWLIKSRFVVLSYISSWLLSEDCIIFRGLLRFFFHGRNYTWETIRWKRTIYEFCFFKAVLNGIIFFISWLIKSRFDMFS